MVWFIGDFLVYCTVFASTHAQCILATLKSDRIVTGIRRITSEAENNMTMLKLELSENMQQFPFPGFHMRKQYKPIFMY